MITKSEEEWLMDEAISEQVAEYLIKPVNPTQIFSACKRVLEKRKIIDQKTTGDYLKDNPPEINLAISSNKAPVAKLLMHFPEKLKTLRQKYLLNGNTSFRAVVSGKLSPAYNPNISTEFIISNGSIINKESRGKLKNILAL